MACAADGLVRAQPQHLVVFKGPCSLSPAQMTGAGRFGAVDAQMPAIKCLLLMFMAWRVRGAAQLAVFVPLTYSCTCMINAIFKIKFFSARD